MNYQDTKGHSVTIEILKNWEFAYEFLCEPLNLGKWALGCQKVEQTSEDGVYSGISLFNKEKGYFKLEVNKNWRIIDFHVGNSEIFVPRISIRIIPGEYYAASESVCMITLDAWRNADMSDARWHQLCVCHETEVFLLKSLIETEG
jgi:hypothetical protein